MVYNEAQCYRIFGTEHVGRIQEGGNFLDLAGYLLDGDCVLYSVLEELMVVLSLKMEDSFPYYLHS